MTIVNMDDMVERQLLEELLTMTEVQLWELQEDYKQAKKEQEEIEHKINNMHREAALLEKRHSKLERVLGGH